MELEHTHQSVKIHVLPLQLETIAQLQTCLQNLVFKDGIFQEERAQFAQSTIIAQQEQHPLPLVQQEPIHQQQDTKLAYLAQLALLAQEELLQQLAQPANIQAVQLALIAQSEAIALFLQDQQSFAHSAPSQTQSSKPPALNAPLVSTVPAAIKSHAPTRHIKTKPVCLNARHAPTITSAPLPQPLVAQTTSTLTQCRPHVSPLTMFTTPHLMEMCTPAQMDFIEFQERLLAHLAYQARLVM